MKRSWYKIVQVRKCAGHTTSPKWGGTVKSNEAIVQVVSCQISNHPNNKEVHHRNMLASGSVFFSEFPLGQFFPQYCHGILISLCPFVQRHILQEGWPGLNCWLFIALQHDQSWAGLLQWLGHVHQQKKLQILSRSNWCFSQYFGSHWSYHSSAIYQIYLRGLTWLALPQLSTNPP